MSTYDNNMKRRDEIYRQLSEMRADMRAAGNVFSGACFTVDVLESLCGGGDGCLDSHTQWHEDMKKAVRALAAAEARYDEVRAHLAVACEALKPPKDWAPPDIDPSSDRDTTELN